MPARRSGAAVGGLVPCPSSSSMAASRWRSHPVPSHERRSVTRCLVRATGRIVEMKSATAIGDRRQPARRGVDVGQPAEEWWIPVRRGRHPAQGLQQHAEKRCLALHQLAPGPIDCHPLDPVDLREFPDFPTPGPLELEGVAGRACDVEIPFQRPDADSLAPRLPALPEEDGLATGSRKADLLFKLAVGRIERVFVGRVLAFGDRPGGVVLARPERARPGGRSGLRSHPPESPGTAGGLRWSTPIGTHHPSTKRRSPWQPVARRRLQTVSTSPQPAAGCERDHPAGAAVARLTSRSGGPRRSHLGGTGFGRSIRPHVF